MKKAAIPVVKTGQAELDRALDAMKQNLDGITGQARNSERLPLLPANASLSQVIATVNRLIERLQ